MNVLVVAPHPDDETLGCGGSLLKHRAAGHSLAWMICTHGKERGEDFYNQRRSEIAEVEKKYGFSDTFQFDIPTTKVPEQGFRSLLKALEESFDRVRPGIVYVPWIGDYHADHRLISNAALIALSKRPFCRAVLAYETLTETDVALMPHCLPFSPNFFHDISVHIEQKLEIMSIYKSEITPPRSLENIRALAKYRGGAAGVEYAEAFQLIRGIWL